MSCELHNFPAERHVRPWLAFESRHPGQQSGAAAAAEPGRSQVAVTCRGETRIFDCEQDLHAAVLVANRDVLAAGERKLSRARLKLRDARIATWRRRRWLHAYRLVRTGLAFAILAGVLAAMAYTLLGGFVGDWL